MPNAWVNEFNNIIRRIIFPDRKLRVLMNLPEDTTIITFIDRYFMRVGTSSVPLKDEDVRIVYSTVGTGLAQDVHVLRQELSFDIYVKLSALHNVGNDRLVYRTELIADRLNEMLTNQYDERLGGYRFRCIGRSEQSTNTIGYVRYNISFAYMRTV